MVQDIYDGISQEVDFAGMEKDAVLTFVCGKARVCASLAELKSVAKSLEGQESKSAKIWIDKQEGISELQNFFNDIARGSVKSATALNCSKWSKKLFKFMPLFFPTLFHPNSLTTSLLEECCCDDNPPIGSVLGWPASDTSFPANYMHCNGDGPLSSSSYPVLFSRIGTTYGGSGGSFYLPDFRGLFLRGFNAGRDPPMDPDSGRSPGSAIQYDEVIEHTHGLPSSFLTTVAASSKSEEGGVPVLTLGGGGTTTAPSSKAEKSDAKAFAPPQTDPYGGAETRPRNQGVYWIIRVL
jgi:microcystin-dependent protein